MLSTKLRGEANVKRVQANPRSGSLLVEYDNQALTVGDMVDLVADVGFIAIGSVAGGGGGLLDVTRSATELLVKASHLDRRVSGISRRAVDGRILAPIGLGALGAAFVVCRNSPPNLSMLPPVLLAGVAVALVRRRLAARPDTSR